MSKTDFDNKLISFNRKFTWNKTKYLEVQKKLNSPTTKDYIFSCVGFILQVMIDLKTRFFIKQIYQGKFTDYVLIWKSKGLYTSKLKPLYTAFLHNTKLLDIAWE